MTRKPRVFFTSDTHYDHENVIRYSHRPYRDKREMTDALIANWNGVVRPEDTLYHLGDVFFCQEERALEILAQLNGTKHLVLGNHDKLVRNSAKVQSHFASIHDLLEINVQGQRIVLCHYPMTTWHRIGRGAWMLHGHCHGNLKYPYEPGKIHDVGVDPNGQTPVAFERLAAMMAKRAVHAMDHHAPDENGAGGGGDKER